MPQNNLPRPDWNDWCEAIEKLLCADIGPKSGRVDALDNAIHNFRAAMKEARAILRLAPPSLKTQAQRLRQSLKAAAGSLAPVRNRYVLSQTLRALARRHSGVAVGVQTVADILPAPLTTEALTANRDALEKARLTAMEAAQTVRSWSNPVEPPELLTKAMLRAVGRAKKRCPADFGEATAEELHSFRSAVISCRYQAAFRHHYCGKPSTRKLEDFEDLRGKLGRFNDLEAAKQALRHFSTDLNAESVKPLLEIAERMQVKARKSAKKISRIIFD